MTLPDLILTEIDRRASEEGKKRSVWFTQFLSEALGLDVFVCEKCGQVFSIDGDEGSLRVDGPWCNKHLHLSKED